LRGDVTKIENGRINDKHSPQSVKIADRNVWVTSFVSVISLTFSAQCWTR